MVENHQNQEVREFIFHNFCQLFTEMPSIPVNILIDPLIKQIQLSGNITYLFNTFDFHLMMVVARHPKMNIKSAI
jgi:hypothetical protein